MCGVHQREQVREVAFGTAFAQQDVHAEAEFFARLRDLDRFMVGTHAGEHVGVEIFSAQAGRMAIDAFAFAGFDFGEFAFCAEIDAGKIHEFSHARHPFVADHQAQIVRCDARAGGFERGGGNTTGQHDEKIERQIFARFEHVTNAVEAEDVGVFVGVNHHGAGAVRDDGAGEFRRGEHGTLHVKMAVDQARREIRAPEIDDFASLVITDAHNAAVIHGDVRGMNFAAEHVDEFGVFEKEFRGLFAAGDAEFLRDVAHC